MLKADRQSRILYHFLSNFTYKICGMKINTGSNANYTLLAWFYVGDQHNKIHFFPGWRCVKNEDKSHMTVPAGNFSDYSDPKITCVNFFQLHLYDSKVGEHVTIASLTFCCLGCWVTQVMFYSSPLGKLCRKILFPR